MQVEPSRGGAESPALGVPHWERGKVHSHALKVFLAALEAPVVKVAIHALEVDVHRHHRAAAGRRTSARRTNVASQGKEAP